MSTELQKITQTNTAISRENWQQSWELIPASADKTPSEILSLNTPQLSALGKSGTGLMIGITIFRAQITSVVKFLGADWSPDQIREAGELAYHECYWFSLAELKQFAIRVKTGFYKSHKNFTPAVFMEFLLEYSNEMHAARGQFYGMSKQTQWQEPEKPVSEERINQAMEQMKQLTLSALNEQHDQEASDRKATVDEFQQRMKQRLATENEQVKALMSQGLNIDEAISELLNLKN